MTISKKIRNPEVFTSKLCFKSRAYLAMQTKQTHLKVKGENMQFPLGNEFNQLEFSEVPDEMEADLRKLMNT